jgi:phenylalanyl-tRNA synthetase beta chain
MRVVFSWLRELCPVDLSPEELTPILDMKGAHVESLARPWEGLEGVVVARVVEVRDHPNSEKLCVARVDAGGTQRELVVGVRNMKPDDLVPLAGPGARVPGLPDPLSSREIRGVVSEGMLCSPRELAISPDHTGILVLPKDAPLGADFKTAFGLDDAVLDLEIEANRPDLLSVMGIAREVSAATGVPLTPPETSVDEGSDPANEAAAVEVLDGEKCPRYLVRVIRGVAVGASPLVAQARLTASGMRPVSNVVDATNYAMLELGHPMHPFDLSVLDGRGVIVRRAEDGERLTTLDDVERVLTDDDLVIADRSRAVGIAGVIGSAYAEVSPSTREVLLESAYFERKGITRTSRRLGLQTEASTRFSRGADPEILGPSADRAARLMVEWSGGEVLAGAIDVGLAPERRRLVVRPERASLVVGSEISASDVADALGRLGIQSEKADGEVRVEVPSFRPDLELEIDLIEEIVRVQGYDSLGSTLPGIKQAGGVVPTYSLRRRVREALVRAGLREALSLSFASAGDLELMGHPKAKAVRLANPPSAADPFLRTSLIPNLLKALARNFYRGVRGAELFEVGHVFCPGEEGGAPVVEREVVACALSGSAGEGVHVSRRELDFFDAKGALETLMDGLGITDWGIREPADPPFHPARSANVIVGGLSAGAVGEIHPGVAERADFTGRVAAFELEVGVLAPFAGRARPFRDIPRFPPVRRDLAFLVDENVPAGALGDAIREAGGPLIDTVVLFDVFRGGSLPEGKKSVAFSVDFRAPDRTLTDEEAEQAVAGIVARLASDFGAELRAG